MQGTEQLGPLPAGQQAEGFPGLVDGNLEFQGTLSEDGGGGVAGGGGPPSGTPARIPMFLVGTSV